MNERGQTQVESVERLRRSILWLGSPDPARTREDGRPTTPSAVSQALELLRQTTHVPLGSWREPSITATAQGEINFVWETDSGNTLDVILPPEPSSPLDIHWSRRETDGTIAHDEREVTDVADAAALVCWFLWEGAPSLRELDEEMVVQLYAEFADEDRALANAGLPEYTRGLAALDQHE